MPRLRVDRATASPVLILLLYTIACSLTVPGSSSGEVVFSEDFEESTLQAAR